MAEKNIPLPPEIPSIMVPTTSEMLLLPNVSVAEIVSHADMEPSDVPPTWLLGHTQWRGLKVPIVSLTIMNWKGSPDAYNGKSTGIAILNSVKGDMKLPFYGIMVTGLPRLVRVLPDSLLNENHKDLAATQYFQAKISGQIVTVPNLMYVEDQLLMQI